jgi:hypothetical protein
MKKKHTGPTNPAIAWWNKLRHDQFTRLNRVRERSISILQKRYGYGREEAIYQLDKHYSRTWLG